MNIVRQRAMGTSRVAIQPRIGPLGRLWSRGLGLTERVASHTLPMAADKTGPLVGGLTTGFGFVGAVLLYASFSGPTEVIVPYSAASLAATAASMYGSAILLPRRAFKHLHWQPLQVEELLDLKGVEIKPKAENLPEIPAMKLVRKFMHNLRGTAPRRPGDGLEQAYLDLVVAVLRQENISEAAQADLRHTLAELGEGVSALPLAEKDEAEVDDLLVEAETQAARARRETDPILSASHLRHADALFARAKAAEQMARRYRQTRTLRDEMAAQIAAVRTALPTLGQTTAQHTIATKGFVLDGVSAQVQAITREAASLTAAQEELAEATAYHSVALPQQDAPVQLQQQGRA
jgi:hypothetical protein